MTGTDPAPWRAATRVAAPLLLAAAVASGQTPPATEIRSEIAPAASAIELRVADAEVHLSLQEAVALALERNLGLRIERYGREQARWGIQQALGIYDLDLTGAVSTAHDESPSASNLEGAEVQEQDREALSLGLGRLFPTGGSGALAWTNGRLETNSQFFTLNPSYSSGFDLSLLQPLLRGFGRDATEFGIEVARLDDDVAREAFVGQVAATIRAAEIAYWNLVDARSRLSVAEESLTLARQLHEDNRVRVDVGTLAPLELVSSEAGVATRDEEIIRARAAIGDAEDVLRYLLDVDDEQFWTLPVVPDTDAATDFQGVDLETALARALAARPELRQELTRQEARRLEAAFYRQDAKPRLDLRATYGYNGVGGDALVRDDRGNVIGSLSGGWNDAIDQITGADFPGWSLGVEFGYPLQNRSARARAKIAALAAEQGDVGIERLRQQVEAEVRVAVRGLQTAQQQIESARVSVRLAERNLDAERRKYENGLSTSFQILEVEENLTAARSRLVESVTGYRKALVEYHRATGTLPELVGVTIVD